MPRNGSGSYTLPEAPFTPNTAISSSAMNSDLSDVGNALTGSLARDGQGGMTAVLPLANTGFTYLTDPNTGMRRTAADTQAIQCGAVDVVTATSTGISVAGTLNVSGAVTGNGFSVLPIGLGPLPWSGTLAPAKWLLCFGQTLLRADFPDLWTFIATEIAAGNLLYTNGNGSTTFTMPDLRGRVPAGKDNMGGVAASRLTSLTFSPNATTVGSISSGSNQGETIALTLSQLPTGITAVGTFNALTSNVVTSSGAAATFAKQSGADLYVAFNNGTVIGVISTLQSSGTVTSNNTSGTAHGNVQPSIITSYIIYAGA